MMSSRQQLSPGTASTMPPIPGDADFGSGCYTTHHPYAAFDATVQHHQQQLYDSTTGLDYAAAFSAFVPQQADNPAPASAHLFPSLPPSFTTTNNNATMLLQPAMLTPHPGLLPASSPMPSDNNAYLQLQQQQQQHPFGGFQLKRENEGGLIFPFSSDAMAAAGSIGGSGSGGGRIGLNLGRRTYFSPADVLAVDRLLMRTRGGLGGGQGAMGVLGLGLGGGGIIGHQMQQPPRCQAEGCKADLSAAKHYHRRHKVCEYHAKAAAVAANGKQQRFCQQCSRFHVLAEFDEAKRSCRKRLTEHNRRRRKPVGVQGKDSPPPPPSKKLEACITTSSYAGDHTNTNKSTAAVLSPSASAFSCLQQQEDQELDDNDEGGGGGRPTTLSLAAPPPQRDYGGALDTMLLMHHHRHHHHHQAAAAVVQEDDHEQAFMMTSLVQSHQQQGDDGNGNILSCSPTSTSDQRRQQHHQMQINDGGDDSGCCNNSGMQQQQQQHFFEVDFM